MDVIDGGWSIAESLASDARCISHEVNARQSTAPIERSGVDGGDAVRDHDAGQSTARSERTVADGGDAVRDRDARQTSAIVERIVADGSDAARHRHVRQSTATLERTGADRGDWEVTDSGWDDQAAGGFGRAAGDLDGTASV